MYVDDSMERVPIVHACIHACKYDIMLWRDDLEDSGAACSIRDWRSGQVVYDK